MIAKSAIEKQGLFREEESKKSNETILSIGDDFDVEPNQDNDNDHHHHHQPDREIER